MKIRLTQRYLSHPAQTVHDFGQGVNQLLVGRRMAVWYDDLDGDGKAEGGAEGEKKAFSSPPATKPKRR